jgi:hypothetical protein
MGLFKNKISAELSAELHGLIDDYSENLIDYIPLRERIEDREELASSLRTASLLTLAISIPTGISLGSAYMDSMISGGFIGSIIPAGLGVGCGLITLLNKYKHKELDNNHELDKPLQASHNNKYAQEFLEKLTDLDIGEAFNDIKKIVDESITNPPKFQENIGIEIRNVLNKNKL